MLYLLKIQQHGMIIHGVTVDALNVLTPRVKTI